jgi:hypothetical protein
MLNVNLPKGLFSCGSLAKAGQSLPLQDAVLGRASLTEETGSHGSGQRSLGCKLGLGSGESTVGGLLEGGAPAF